MEDSIISPDFDIGISEDANTQDVWRSDSSDTEGSQPSVDARQPEDKDKGEEIKPSPKNGTEQQLKKLLNIKERQTSASRSRRRHRSKRRRVSPSRSKTTDHSDTENAADRGSSYISPTKIADIFENGISPEKLCELSTLKHGSPATVLKIMPKASVKQICQMVHL